MICCLPMDIGGADEPSDHIGTLPVSGMGGSAQESCRKHSMVQPCLVLDAGEDGMELSKVPARANSLLLARTS